MLGVLNMFDSNGEISKIGEFGLSEFFNFSLAKNLEETELFVKVDFNLIRVYLDIPSLTASSPDPKAEITIPRGSITTFVPFGKFYIAIATKEGHIYIFGYNKAGVRLLSNDKILETIGCMATNLEGSILTAATMTTFKKTKRILVYSLSGETKKPVMLVYLDLFSTPMGMKPNSSFCDISMSVVNGREVILAK